MTENSIKNELNENFKDNEYPKENDSSYISDTEDNASDKSN